jgi:DMSO/TMAO reductase YedYZ molybdopterin-dependent catalytic subunit
MKEYKEYDVSAKQVRKRTIFSLVVFAILIIVAISGWQWLRHQPTDNEAREPLRKVLNFNELFFGRIFSNSHMEKSFPPVRALKNPRVNGMEGISDGFDPSTWKLKVARKAGDTLYLSIDDIKSLPKTEIVFDFKCIEGWSQVTHWGGVLFSDFAKKYGLNKQTDMKFAGLTTPDDGYYVGIDMPSMLHPQTILCYEMNGKPLSNEHGAPLRLIIPVKYGIKHLKRIGTVFFSNERPADYWYERGYDYYSGL